MRGSIPPGTPGFLLGGFACRPVFLLRFGLLRWFGSSATDVRPLPAPGGSFAGRITCRCLFLSVSEGVLPWRTNQNMRGSVLLAPPDSYLGTFFSGFRTFYKLSMFCSPDSGCSIVLLLSHRFSSISGPQGGHLGPNKFSKQNLT